MNKKVPIIGRPPGTGAPSSDAVWRVRMALGLTQENLARELDCSSSAIRKMETQNRLPGHEKLMAKFKRVAKRAGIDIEEKSAP